MKRTYTFSHVKYPHDFNFTFHFLIKNILFYADDTDVLASVRRRNPFGATHETEMSNDESFWTEGMSHMLWQIETPSKVDSSSKSANEHF